MIGANNASQEIEGGLLFNTINKHNMEYNELKAKEIIAKHNLSDKTLKVWKSRGKIPAKYEKEDYKQRETSNAGNIKHERLMNLLKSNLINVTVLAKLTEINATALRDAKRGTARLSDADIDKIKIEIKRLKILIAKTFEKFSPRALRILTQNKLLVYTKILENKELANQISYVRLEKQEATQQLFNSVKDKYIIFAMTLNI